MRQLLTLLVAGLLGAGCSADASPSANSPMASARPTGEVRSAPPSAAVPGSPAITASPAASTAVTDAYRWEMVAAVDGARDRRGDWRLIAGSPLGYVAITRSPPTAWFSTDGSTWTRHGLSVPHGVALSAEAVAGDDQGFVVVGHYSPCSLREYRVNPFVDCRARPVSWVSTDGLAWQESPPWSGPIGEPGRSGSTFYAVWPVPTGGWDAAQALDPSDDSDDFELEGPAIWHAPDAVSWTLLKPLPADEHGCGPALVASELDGAADVSGRRIAAAGEGGCLATAWTSADGATWTPLAGFDGSDPEPVVTVGLPADGVRPWRLLGYGLDAAGDTTGAVSWTATDHESWEPTELPGATEGGLARAAARGPSIDVAVGWGSDRTPLTWVSEGTGPWARLDGSAPPIESLAWGPAGAVGLVGTWDTRGDEVIGFEAWRLAPVRP